MSNHDSNESGAYATDAQFPVLVVDDEVLVADFLTQALEEMGFNVVNAHTVTDALQIARQHSRLAFACVDLGLPDRSGLELIHELRQWQADLPIIIATGYGDRVQLDDQGPDDALTLLSKPYDVAAVVTALRKVGVSLPEVS